MADTILQIEGMTCAGCAAKIEKKLSLVPGVQKASVNFASQKAHLQIDPVLVPAGTLEKAVCQIGYGAKLYLPEAKADPLYRKEARRLGWRLVLGGLFILPFFMQHLLMLLRPFQFSPWLQFFWAAPVYVVVGWPFHQAALRGLRHGEATMDSLVSLGSSAAFFASLPVLFGGPGNLYFDAFRPDSFFRDPGTKS